VKVAIPLFGTRVSPRWSYSEKILLVQFEDAHELSRNIAETIGMSEEARLSQLADLEVDLFICGAMEEEYISIAESYGIDVIHNVAGEVDEIVSALQNDRLHSGYGLNGGLIQESVLGVKIFKKARPKMDCVECIDRICLKGENCTREFGEIFPVENYQQLHHSMEVTADIAAEKHRRLCRVAEFIYYCLEMEYRHVGVAFCVEMYRETEILTRLLRRFFKVSPVCCKVGGRIQPDLVTASNGVLCNPIGQARILNRIETDINALVGLCVGCDLIYTRHSKAPTSTLFVKDKSLANNPVSALYSKYYIDEILKEL
jgi:uncharacterized metal-binding protein/predicted Fe-Mo cluster-binding NifX family protein